MSISVKCPGCDKQYAVKDDLAGRTVQCRNCQTPIKVPPLESMDDNDVDEPVDLKRTARPARPASAKSNPLASFAEWEPSGTIVGLGVFGILAATVAVVFYVGWQGISPALDSPLVPQDKHGQIYASWVLRACLILIATALLSGGAVLVSMAIASAIRRESSTGSMPLRALSIGAAPTMLGFLSIVLFRGEPVLGAGPGHNPLTGMFLLGIGVTITLLPVLLRYLGGLRWMASAIATPISAVLLVVALLATGYTLTAAAPKIDSMVGLTNPQDELATKAPPPSRPGNSDPSRIAPNNPSPMFPDTPVRPNPMPVTPVTPVDPVTGQLEALGSDVWMIENGLDRETRETLEAKLAAAAEQLSRIDPTGKNKAGWEAMQQRIEAARERIKSAVSKEPPQTLFADADKPQDLAADASLIGSRDVDAFPGVRLKAPANAVVSLNDYDSRRETINWLLPDRSRVTMKLLLIREMKQRHPWFDTRRAAGKIAEQNGLLQVDADPATVVASKTPTGVTVDSVVRKSSVGGQTHSVHYARLGSGFVSVEATGVDANANTEKLATAVAASLRDASVDDFKSAFTPEEIAPRLANDFDGASAVLRKIGKPALPAIDAYLASLTDSAAKAKGKWLRDQITGVTPPPIATPGNSTTPGVTPHPPAITPNGPIDVDGALAVLSDSAAAVDAKKTAFDSLARAKLDPAKRDAVAEKLEDALLKEDRSTQRSVADALKVWWRPKRTVVALLPGLEHDARMRVDVDAVIDVVSETKEKEGVFPIVRWIIEKPDVVVAALKKMGPVAEDEVIKLLREQNDDVRYNAAKILQEIGTRKSMAALYTAGKDARFRKAAAAAQIAYDDVKTRVKSSTQPTSAPAEGR
ncbi:MAG: hypothetical protein QM770_08075 [Tepidisphaeraceae bacterium]